MVRYPQYNGAIEYAQRELKEALEAQRPPALASHVAAAQQLNHRPRLCLGGRTACAAFQAGRETMKTYTGPKRKEVISWIQSEALDIIRRSGLSGVVAQDAAWRRAVESWLHRIGAITVSVNGKVLPCFL